ncbi:putative membrane protein [Mobilisporobacter senegalensis]|uniref:Putative membrane protein n=1 Tax=Mobilisporobacter senegalensis TaxID=1329262 RepID=A0A3N1XZ53_9FIRM|nr:YibE/F family protein [Mobilisporobacter senegalensis]ROR31870.1 putative membrane protein [Mobilisporobacter senegalensis]
MSKEYKERFLKIMVITILIVIFSGSIYIVNQGNPDNNSTDGTSSVRYVNASVTSIIEDNAERDAATQNVWRGEQTIEISITEGEHKGETAVITNYLSALHNVYLKKGTQIIVRVDTYDGQYSFSVYNYNRSTVLYGFIGLFALTICIIGGKKGIKSLLSLVFAMICVIGLLLPLIAKGYPVLPVTIFIVAITTVAGFILIDGLNTKTISAIVGTITGVIISGVLSYIVGELVAINGFNMEEAESLLQITSDSNLEIKYLFVAGILISSLGAVMDVAMSIASAMHELCVVNPRLRPKELFRSGMNIGKDAMGTMSNTLILAFTGSSLNLMLMIFSYGIPFQQLINTDMIGIEIIRGIAGSIGIILTVPVVALVSTRIELRKIKK